MPREGNNIKIPLKTKDAIAGLMKVRPTANMPRMGKSKSGGMTKRKPVKKG